jgi:hypothetical protein
MTRSTVRIGLPLVLGLLCLAGCVEEPTRPVVTRHEVTPPPPPPDTNVYFYPTQGHNPSAEQQDRDRYECNGWAVQKTGFDPSLPNIPPRQRVRVVAGGPPPGAGVATGAITGAVVGAAVSDPWHRGPGALIGAIAGAAIGGAADAQRATEQDRVETEVANANDARSAALDQKASNYRRAMSACLEGRGYSVR